MSTNDVNHKIKNQNKIEPWTVGHSMYFMQFCLAVSDGEITRKEYKTIEEHMKKNTQTQKNLGEDGIDEKVRFEEAIDYYNETVRMETMKEQLQVFISTIPDAVNWNMKTLTNFTDEMFELACVELPSGIMVSAKKEILQTMINKWGIERGLPAISGDGGRTWH